ncbi:hypothetical protein AVEN_13260-1 [Araneus ventricosus]|uniref:Uncharacterized protein n=1 Tax=Araneus ventricosus TaxID=182803 RepID=A0A4Y2DP25_ARAVE|nr:hypothetical protein AVEN_13260-1 [Araneus ventricosus]
MKVGKKERGYIYLPSVISSNRVDSSKGYQEDVLQNEKVGRRRGYTIYLQGRECDYLTECILQKEGYQKMGSSEEMIKKERKEEGTSIYRRMWL